MEICEICWGCGYDLRGSAGPRCPECGRAFDRNNPKSLNTTGVVNGFVRRLLARPLGWLAISLAVVATGLIAATTRFSLGSVEFSFTDVRYLTRQHAWTGVWRNPREYLWTDLSFVAGLELWALVLVMVLAGAGLRWFFARRYRPALVQAPRRRVMQFIGLVILSAVLAPLGEIFRLAKGWVGPLTAQRMAGRPPAGFSWPLSLYPTWAGMSADQQETVLRYAMRSLGPADRVMAAGMVVEAYTARGLTWLLEAARYEKDPHVRAAFFMLIALYRDRSTAEILAAALDDPDAVVRAAAADALGIVHAPAFEIPFSDRAFDAQAAYQPVISGRPGPWISLSELVEYSISRGTPRPSRSSDDHLQDSPIPLPVRYRIKLEGMMLRAATSQEREAAARALVCWPPEKYQLRVAEWGVWVDDKGELKLMQSLLDEIPPFVHRLGNPLAEFADRVNQIMIITKPIVHITTGAPMAVDVGVEILGGRPWFAYPRPDDFVVTAGDFGQYEEDTNPDGTPKLGPGGRTLWRTRTAPVLAGLDPPAAFGRLDGIRQGYPGIFPEHPTTGSMGGQLGSENDIGAMGVRWQSVIATPGLPAWATLAAVPDDAKYLWWNRLRQVDSSYVISRNEAERFLYYDGPTRLPSPLDAQLKQQILTWRKPQQRLIERQEERSPRGLQQSNYFSKAAIFIRVRQGHATAVRIPEDAGLDSAGSFALPARELFSADAPGMLLKILSEGGLNNAEANGLIDAWSPQFFSTEGDRMLVRLSSVEYDELCPIQIRPLPTTLARVGLILVEFGK